MFMCSLEVSRHFVKFTDSSRNTPAYWLKLKYRPIKSFLLFLIEKSVLCIRNSTKLALGSPKFQSLTRFTHGRTLAKQSSTNTSL